MWRGLRQHPAFKDLVALRSTGDACLLAKALRCMSVGRQAPLWGSLDAVGLAIVGDMDDTYCSIADEMAEQCKLKVVELEGCGHAVHIENAVGVAGALTQWLRS